MGNHWLNGIMGVVTGDALGCPVQFQSRETVARNPVRGMRGYGTFDLPEGTWTDDSSMTLALLDSIRENGLEHLLLDRTTVIVDRMKAHRNPDSFAREQVEYFVAHGLMTTVLRWHRFGFQSTPKEMAKVFGRLLASTDASVARLLL